MISPAPPPEDEPAADSSARIRVKAPTALFTAAPLHPPGAGATNNPPAHPPEAGGLPDLPDIQWERKRDGSIEAWHAPEGKGQRNRTGKTYLGRIGKRQLNSWESLNPADRQEAIHTWTEQKRTAKL